MKQVIQIRCKNNKKTQKVEIGSTLFDVFSSFDLKMTHGPVSARVNNKVEGMHYRVYNSKDVEFLDMTTASGSRAYTRTLFFVLCKAVQDIYPATDVVIDIPVSNGFYVDIRLGRPVVDEDVQVISNREQFVKMLAGLPDDMEEYMIRQYRNLCMDQLVLKQYAKFIDILFRQEKGAVLWHCGTGKDRTGIGTAFLLSLLGVEEDVIYEDYLRTNRYMEPKLVYMQRLVQTWPEADEKMTEKLPIIYNVKEEYLAAVFETVKKTYGSMEKFFQTVFYLKPKMIEEFRNKYLI